MCTMMHTKVFLLGSIFTSLAIVAMDRSQNDASIRYTQDDLRIIGAKCVSSGKISDQTVARLKKLNLYRYDVGCGAVVAVAACKEKWNSKVFLPEVVSELTKQNSLVGDNCCRTLWEEGKSDVPSKEIVCPYFDVQNFYQCLGEEEAH